MSIEKIPGGTRGGRLPPGPVSRLLTPLMMRMHRRGGDRFQGMDLLYLTTRGARSGQLRTAPVARFDDGRGGWVVVASAGGAARHPGWYHNMIAHPDQVWTEVGGVKHQVRVEQLAGEERQRAWDRVVSGAPRFAKYLDKTDRTLPVLRLTPVEEDAA
jgi:deazaflavin-dependent oxidoreductase (nitroreductase family)